MKKKLIISLALILVLAVTVPIYTIVSRADSKLSKEKAEFQQKHDEIVKKQEEKSKSDIKKEIQKARSDLQSITEIKDEPIYSELIVRTLAEHPDFQYLPMPCEVQKQYCFSTEGFTPYNWVITGCFADNPNDGFIINYNGHRNLDTEDGPRYIHKVPSIGKITLTGMNDDKTKLFFRTASGKTGEFDVTPKKGIYKIHDK